MAYEYIPRMAHSANPTRKSWYPENAEDPTIIAAFDTDLTVDVPSRGQPGPVPPDHVIELRKLDHVSVWATGFNQSLRDLAQIPGMRELKRKLDVNERFVDRHKRMLLLDELFPDATYKFVVDDVDLSLLEPDWDWDYYFPQDYAHEMLGLDVSRRPSPRPYLTREERREKREQPPRERPGPNLPAFERPPLDDEDERNKFSDYLRGVQSRMRDWL